MIIKNNFDDGHERQTKILLGKEDEITEYKEIGKGSFNMDKKLQELKKCKVFDEVLNKDDRENDDTNDHDNWEMFK